MPKDLRKEIENHLATFPERHEDIIEMKNEWASFKAKALWLMVGFISSVLGIGVWVGTIQAEHSHFENVLNTAITTDNRYELRINALEINNSEIRARLTSIEVTLQEIKTAIIKLQ